MFASPCSQSMHNQSTPSCEATISRTASESSPHHTPFPHTPRRARCKPRTFWFDERGLVPLLCVPYTRLLSKPFHLFKTRGSFFTRGTSIFFWKKSNFRSHSQKNWRDFVTRVMKTHKNFSPFSSYLPTTLAHQASMTTADDETKKRKLEDEAKDSNVSSRGLLGAQQENMGKKHLYIL